MNNIDFDAEYSLFVNLVGDLWDIDGHADIRIALRKAFDQGLKDARYWISDNIQFDISRALNGEDDIILPLDSRRKIFYHGDDGAYLTDALYIFHSHLMAGIRDLSECVNGWPHWNYSNRADSLCSELACEFSIDTVEPKNCGNALLNNLETAPVEASQKKLICGYTGFAPVELRSNNSINRLSESYAQYARYDQGMSYVRTIFSAMYSHGLACREEYNRRRFIEDLLPVYQLRDTPINFDNGEDILAVAVKNEFVKMVNDLQPFVFSSTEYYLKSQTKKLETKRQRESGTPEQKAKHAEDMEKYISSLIDGMDESIESRRLQVKAYMDALTLTLQ